MSACSICGVNCPPEADAVNAGGDVGRVHDACFQDWDRRAEAFESYAFMGCDVPMLIAELKPRGRKRVAA